MIVHQDDALLVADKPSGMPTQPDPSGDEALFTQLQRRFPTLSLHHRLDRPTSGLVLFTLDPAINRAITEAFRSHTIQRTYLGVVDDEGFDETWTWPLDGKTAVTHAEVLGEGGGLTAMRFRLETGRTHQIRKHAAMAGSPLIGDRRYGGAAGQRWPRLALHAASLTLDHPVTGQTLHLSSPIPADLQALWTRAGGPPIPR